MKRLVLRHPESTFADLKSRSQSAAWGGVVRTYDLPGGPYRFSGLSAAQAEAVEQRFGPWRLASHLREQRGTAESGVAPVQTTVCTVCASAFDQQSVEGVTSSLVRKFESSEVRISGFELAARMEWSGAARGGAVRGYLATPIDGTLADGSTDPRWLDAFENYLRAAVAYRVLSLGGAMFHSSGVRTADGVHLFVGPSGAGKTTVARLSLDLGFDVFSDDINVVLPGPGSRSGEAPGGALFVERLPFAGELGDTRSSDRPYPEVPAPLIGIHRLVQEVGHEVRGLSNAHRLAALVGSCPFVNADPHRLETLLDNLEPLLPLVDELAFREDPGFWELLPGHQSSGFAASRIAGTTV